MLSKSSFGKIAESWVARKLATSGWKIVAQNFRAKFGEVDIVAVDGDTLVFVEVKTRRSARFGLPEEAVSKNKLRRIARAGELFASLHPELPQKLRIDVAAVSVREGKVVGYQLIENASG